MLNLTEKQIQKLLMDWLETLREGFFWENFTTGIPCVNQKTGQRFNRKLPSKSRHASDILGLHIGRMCAFEVKTPKEYKYIQKHYDRLKMGMGTSKRDIHLSGQIAFIEAVKEKGGIAGFVCSIECVEKLLFQNYS